ncbi:MAG: hypothetical protein WCJ30_00210, partial [Deltaproteobacteria bacterium]
MSLRLGIARLLFTALATAAVTVSSGYSCSPFPGADGGSVILDGEWVDAGADGVPGDAQDVRDAAEVRPSTCVDLDRDGFGLNCSAGVDCDDRDANITDGCYRCLGHPAGCPCEPGAAPVSCDLLTDTDHAYAGECHPGQRNCVNGEWGHCVTVGDHALRTIEAIGPCGDICTPDCQTAGACPSEASEVATGTGVAIGGDPAPVFCPPGSPDGGVTLVGGPNEGVGRGGGTGTRCTNLCLLQVGCAGGRTTTVTGTVRAPTPSTYLAAGRRADPLYGAVVYIPNGRVEAFTPGVTCDQCGAIASGDPLVQAATGYDGRFTLTNVPVGDNIPLVIQLGRWRRQVRIPHVTACATLDLD